MSDKSYPHPDNCRHEWSESATEAAKSGASIHCLRCGTERLSNPAQPIDMVLHCPKCRAQHVDAPDQHAMDDFDPEVAAHAWANPPHKSHLCHACGCIWRPADVPTNGVKAIATRGKNDNYAPEKEAL